MLRNLPTNGYMNGHVACQSGITDCDETEQKKSCTRGPGTCQFVTFIFTMENELST